MDVGRNKINVVKLLVLVISVMLASELGFSQESSIVFNFDIAETTVVDSNITGEIHAYFEYSYSIDKKGYRTDIKFEKIECDSCTEVKKEELKKEVMEMINTAPKIKRRMKKAYKNLRIPGGYKMHIIGG